jgi:hypothetical protein
MLLALAMPLPNQGRCFKWRRLETVNFHVVRRSPVVAGCSAIAPFAKLAAANFASQPDLSFTYLIW